MGQVGGESVTFGLTLEWQSGHDPHWTGDLGRPEVGRAPASGRTEPAVPDGSEIDPQVSGSAGDSQRVGSRRPPPSINRPAVAKRQRLVVRWSHNRWPLRRSVPW